jgi:ABC-type phosphate transport system substrate-binding protein
MKKIIAMTLFLVAMLTLASRVEAQVLVIANSSVKAAEISKGDLRDVFTGASTSLKDGSRAVPVLLKSGAVNDEFLTAYVGKSDSAFRASWRSLVFSGQASMPKTFDSDAALVEYVAHTSGAIGYINKTSPHEGVKVLAVR